MEPTEATYNGNADTQIISWFEESAENVAAVQRQTLRRILELNHGVEYLKKWLGNIRLQDIMNENALESVFATLVPLASHADFEPYIQRIADGETAPLITQEPITTLSLSSGTTEGRQKFVPFTHHSSQTTLQIFKLAAAYRSRIYSIRGGGKVLEFIYSSKQYKTKGGLIAGTATTHYYSSKEFKIKQQDTKSFTCSPEEVISSVDYKQSTYCHLLLGLYFSEEVEFVTSTFAYSIVQAFRSFEELWKELCHDIREGTLSSRINITKVRKAVLGMTLPNPELASRIESICEEVEKEDWFSIIPRLWPNAKYVYSIMTGSVQPYLTKLRHYAGELPLVSADYGSTESWIGVNVEPSSPPEKVTFAIIPTFAYFEFIPLHRTKSQNCNNSQDANLATDDFIEDDPVPLSKVKIGQEYEIVLTTFTGLYRYRLGDVVEVAGFYKNTPKLNFICRRKLILTVNIDKNTEKDLQLVVERGSQILSKSRAELVDFTSHANVAKRPGHYVIYWEIKGEVEEKVLGECCREMDASFVDHGYVVSRKTNSIGPLELCIVERGTFKKILEHFIGNGAALSQFKTPRCTSNQVLLRILNVCTIKRFYSTAYGL
ncbi:PREDICTED: jasmonic acid-amido synthetase JAR1-like [Nicotiana attenuata]|uniref:Jasmonic acid-amido synthetase jar1 n=1 Tax=Nicotiana attenuata TaxID=49451 RepID=A0A314L5J6_NICAT|nr:PREDICTED: jasmonic acid-amido synthetase JAR1-like [Nicotiana attenuata]OIT36858.1 jasmonic acid-amido synthetase jar1 [Nicotiana attenuata]